MIFFASTMERLQSPLLLIMTFQNSVRNMCWLQLSITV